MDKVNSKINATPLIRILLVDDHPIVCEGLSLLLGCQPDFAICGQADRSSEALSMARVHPVDVLILDLTLRDESGFDLLAEFKRRFPKILVLILSMHGDTETVRQAFRLGANGYMRKEDAAEHLATAIRRIRQGEMYLSPGLSHSLLVGDQSSAQKSKKECGDVPKNAKNLTARELEILGLLLEGKGVSAIADSLCISRKTIDAHQSNMKRKLGIGSNRELLIWGGRWYKTLKS